MEQNVRPPAGSYPRQSSNIPTIGTQKLRTMQTHTSPIEAQVETNHILIFYDDFGVKYVGKQHAYHLINNIQEHYQVSIDWEGKRYSGIIIKFKYQNK